MELSRIASALPDDTITIVPTENQMLFQVGGVILISRLIDGQFPNYRQLIPETFDYEVAVDHDELLEAVRRVGLLAQKNAPLRHAFRQQHPHGFRRIAGCGESPRSHAGAVLR